MNQYLIVSFQAVVLFPIVVAVFTLPYIAYNYHKYGSILSLKVLIVYSFIFYLLCMYCLVILPLPSPEKAATLHSHKSSCYPKRTENMAYNSTEQSVFGKYIESVFGGTFRNVPSLLFQKVIFADIYTFTFTVTFL